METPARPIRIGPGRRWKDIEPRVMLWALGMAGAAILSLTSALFAGHASSNLRYQEKNDSRVFATQQAVDEIRSELALKRATDERQEKLLRAIARKLQVSVSEVEDGQ